MLDKFVEQVKQSWRRAEVPVPSLLLFLAPCPYCLSLAEPDAPLPLRRLSAGPRCVAAPSYVQR